MLDEFRGRVQPDADLEPTERLRASLRALVEFAAEHPRGYRSMFHRYHNLPEVHELLEKSRQENLREVASNIGADPDDAATYIALRAWSGAVDQALLGWLDQRGIGIEALLTTMIAPLVGLIPLFRSDLHPGPEGGSS